MTENVQNLNNLNLQKSGSQNDGQPHLDISEQPQSRGFRFRYQCEGTSHGGLQGESSRRDHKTYPGVKIVGFKGPARITVSLVTDESVPRPHAHELIGKNCKNGICVVDLKGDHMTATFPNLGVRHVTKKKVVDILSERIVEAMKVDKMMAGGVGYDPEKVHVTGDEREKARNQAEEQAKSMSLNTVRLCFQAYLQDSNGTFSQMLPSVISSPIYDSKAPGSAALKICRMDKHAGCCLGSEEVFMLCDKVQKDDIAVRFYEEDEESNVKWQGYGVFGPADVHRQYAIVFKTPQYWNADIDRPVPVHVQLVRMSDQEASDPKPFTYYPQQRDQEEIAKKKRKQIPHFGGGSMSGTFPPSGSSRDLGGHGQGSGISGGGQGGDFNHYNTAPQVSPAPIRLRPGTPPTDESSRDSATTVSSMSVDSDLRQSDIEMDCVPHAMQGDVHNHGVGKTKVPSKIQHSTDDTGRSQPHKFMRQGQTVDTSGKAALTNESAKAAMDFAWHVAERTSKALQDYARTGDIFCLLSVQRHLVAVQDDYGDNILHTAIMNNQAEAVCHLLEAVRTIPKNTVVNQCNHMRQTPLHLAVLTNQPDIVELLLLSGAASYVQDKHGCTPIHLAAKMGLEKCLEMLMTLGNSPFASDMKPLPEVDFLNYDGFSALHLAVSHGTLSPVKLLVEEGKCDVNQPDGRSGRTALHHAVGYDNLAICGYILLEAEADADAPDYDGNTPLHLAAAGDSVGIAALLIAAGADPDLENSWLKEENEEEIDESGATVGTKRKADQEMDLEDYRDDLVGCTPRDLVTDNENMLRILSGESYKQISEMWTQTLQDTKGIESSDSLVVDSGIHSPGDLDKLDPLIRAKMANLLDQPAPTSKANWQQVAERLGMAPLVDAFSLTPSPTKALLDNYEVLDGTVADLIAVLRELDRQDVVTLISSLLSSLREVPSTHKQGEAEIGQQKLGKGLDSIPRPDSGFNSVEKNMAHLSLNRS